MSSSAQQILHVEWVMFSYENELTVQRLSAVGYIEF